MSAQVQPGVPVSTGGDDIQRRLAHAVEREKGSTWVRRIGPFTPLLLILVWEVLSRFGVLDARFFPAPSSIVETFIKMLLDGVLIEHAAMTLSRIAVGFVLGAIPGVLLGVLLGSVRPLRQLLEPIFASLLPIPKVAIFPLLLLIFGLGETSKYVIVAIGVFFYLFFNTMSGVMQTPPLLVDVARANGATRIQRWFTVSFPYALPSIFTGLKLATGGAFVIIAASEFVGSQSGLGYLIWSSWSTFAVSKMYVGIVTISVLGYAATALESFIERRVVPWVKY
ncbi:ABC transporter permease [Leucobacter luti]|uniref:NitT/TauT family transport system permease protein n=1 Tax=Leucobacter luti TaxID=340320 RepID=A0A4R6RTK5_9MICO|nr:ABC transporter permease [Leucobacter luti]MCW2287921.1 NitT/TauT family transport system permease protein [Leucobacter luti]QYM76081.1 ABC transporter permease [Leucobacter luti]TCK45917.1 NitT/TauT family transport system permease protein [Leucobacter luti]TDP90190.1 NitT/TauT family transport system permease protein [Leucobacter luti]